MKVKTSIAISEDILQRIGERLGRGFNRSEFFEKAARDYLERQAQNERNRKDLVILNKNADKLNREAEDVLSYQVGL